MSEEQKEYKCRKIGKHYAEFSKDEFERSSPYTVGRLCEAIKADNYGLTVTNSSLNSISKLNELLECIDFPLKVISKKTDWSIDVAALMLTIRDSGESEKKFSEFSYDTQINTKRLNRLFLEEAYPEVTPKSSKFFIPSELLITVETFEDHYKVANGEPILIIGRTGVGKSLFLHIFETLYREEHEDENKYPIIKANCAHFGGDPNLVRSELFGHMKGAFTGAIYEKTGLVEMANGGVLVLEEIGDLPFESQATLLTFIETGEFYRVGDDRGKSGKNEKEVNQDKNQQRGPRKANVQIVGLTNREENLRDDFNHRFFPFYIPPIHQRRMDILYYFQSLLPDLFKSMKPYEIMTLMTYHWPGNVREIERVGRLLQRHKETMKRITFSSESDRSSFEAVKLYNLDPNNPHLTIDAYHVMEFYNDLVNNGVDVELLESILNVYQLGLKESRDIEDSFIPGDLAILDRNMSERYGLRFTYHVESFKRAYQGIIAFAELFYKDPMANVNLLDLKEDFVFSDPFNELIQYPKDEKDRFQKMIKSIFEFLSELKLLESDVISENIFQRDDLFTTLGEANPGNHFLASLGFSKRIQERETKDLDLCSFKFKELLKLYFQTILDRVRGNQTEGAKLAGMPIQSFRDALKRNGIVAGRKSKMGLKV